MIQNSVRIIICLILFFDLSQGQLNVNIEEKNYRKDLRSRRNEIAIKILGEDINPIISNEMIPDLSPLNSRLLMKLLDDKFDSLWTSIKKPNAQQYEETISYDPKLELYVDLLNISSVNGKRIPLDTKKTMQQWLVEKASCKMKYYWEDLGNLFWPQFIKRGACVNYSASSCSWPPGMKCRLTGSHTIHFLRWSCYKSEEPVHRKRKKRNSQLNKPKNLHKSRQVYSYWNPVRRQRQVKNLVRRTSLWKKGFQCEWKIKNFNTSNRCECSCE